jgi:hypothetical protein
MAHAFPEDELRPVSCKPQTRNRENPADIGLNDVLGNYSVTLVDSLSTLAILASDEEPKHAKRALKEFQSGIKTLVELYGDGTEKGRCGKRACGFDLDSKVQVFETNIRGVGGLLSAHLFAVGDLPIRGYSPAWKEDWQGNQYIQWKGFKYDGQLLRLAHDLASRLLPAFNTTTGLPYPRANLRHGIPFYRDAEAGICRLDGTSSDPREITETCSAGAGSLVLEFTTLSRLTGDSRFEALAKKAFWAVWERRSSIGLIGGGIDAESGQWTMPPLAGIGAGIDSFFEYALKSHILLSGLPYNATSHQAALQNDPESFLRTWQQAHGAVRRHISRSPIMEKHPYYGQSDLITGAARYSWIDNLSAYYPGLLTLAGELEEAAESHLVYAALWTRYSALPERWHAHNSAIDPSFKHWAGRPEFIESTYYLYQATKDPWYLHVGEMAIRDIRRRCWTKCGWADLGDVVSGEQRDRMESFFLGETAKYLYLLFTADHPLNTKDAPIVFSTEGHPLIIPLYARKAALPVTTFKIPEPEQATVIENPAICAVPPSPLSLTVSNAANRADLFHAAALAQLHLVPKNPTRSSPILQSSDNGPGISLEDIHSPSNYTFYPWTLPQSLIPPMGTSAPIRNALISTLSFPNLNPDPKSLEAEKGLVPLGALQKVLEGVLINSLSNIRLNMVQEPKSLLLPNGEGVLIEVADAVESEYRIHGISNWALGKDEKVLVSSNALEGVSPADPHFTRVKDLEMVDLVVDVLVLDKRELADTDAEAEAEMDEELVLEEFEIELPAAERNNGTTTDSLWQELEAAFASLLSDQESAPKSVKIGHDNKAEKSKSSTTPEPLPTLQRYTIPAILPTGAGAAPLPLAIDNGPDPLTLPSGHLPYNTIYFLDSTLCTPNRLPAWIAKTHNILILKRGDCLFNEKLANIPSFTPSDDALQLVIVLSTQESESDPERLRKQNGEGMIRPLLDEPQRTPNGFERRHPVAMVMVDATNEGVVEALEKISMGAGRFDGSSGKFVEGKRVQKWAPVVGTRKPGLGVKRRYWFESMGVPIGNLILV